MAEGTYEYECMRAELLGVAKPDYEQFLQKKQEEAAANPEAATVEDGEENTNEEGQGDAPKQSSTGGKMDELNNIISITQKKIDNFKIRCGSVSDMIKTKIGNISGAAAGSAAADVPEATEDGAAAPSNTDEAPKEDATNSL